MKIRKLVVLARDQGIRAYSCEISAKYRMKRNSHLMIDELGFLLIVVSQTLDQTEDDSLLPDKLHFVV